ncbi:hypothetical protein N665_0172s0098 [Sinapis alba]|nr:hypothetical protein N665_0172s0098 [Sinapis alba]
MRLFSEPDIRESEEIKEFSKWILDLGDGKIKELNNGECIIVIPKDLLITECNDSVEAIVCNVYERAILSPTSVDVDVINNYMLDRLSGEEMIYLSSGSIDPTDLKSKDDPVFSPEFLHNTKLPFKMRRRQFPLKVAFAMTINKSQSQSLANVGLYLPKHVFSHGQLYVAVSRVRSRKGLKILITDKHGKPQDSTMNVVYKEVFQNLLENGCT